MRRALSILGLTAALVVLAQPAMGMTWGPESTYYKGIRRATGSGDFWNDRNVRAINRITVIDEANDHNRVYGFTEFFFRYGKCEFNYNFASPGNDCREDFRSGGTKTTPEIENTRKWFDHEMNLAPTGTRTRARTFACVQMGWPVPDGCAEAAYPTFDY